MAASSSEDEHHWPGYVDALTTMTMMLTFIMCILAIAIYGISQNISREMVEKMAVAAHVDASPEIEKTADLAKRIISRLQSEDKDAENKKVALAAPHIEAPSIQSEESGDKLPAEGHRITSLKQVETASAGRKIDTERSAALLTLAFEPRATALDQKAVLEMQTFLSEEDGAQKAGIIEVKAYASVGGAVSDGRRVAFYRLIEIRKRLIAFGIPATRIEIRVDDRKGLSDGNLVQIFSRTPV